MADVRESFATLEDSGTGAGLPLHKVLEGDAAAAKNASAGLVAKDNSNNLIYLRTDASGNLLTKPAAEYACLTDAAEATGSLTVVDVCTITATVNKVYRVFASGSCYRHATFTVVAIADVGGSPVSTELGYFKCGPGEFTSELNLSCIEWTAGGTGVQNIVLRAKNDFLVASDFDGVLTAQELV